MRWFRFGSSKHEAEHDPARQQEIYRELRQDFGQQPAPGGVYGQPAAGGGGVYGQPAGGGVYGRPAGGASSAGVYGQPAAMPGNAPGSSGFGAQAGQAARLFDGDDGIMVASVVLREYAEAVYKALAGQGLEVDRRHYRWSWEGAGPRLRSPLTAGALDGFHPYVQVAAAVTVLGGQAKHVVKVVDPHALLAHVLEILDLVTSGWEYGGVRPDSDQANLAASLITTARAIRDALPEEPPLPNPIREQMRRNNTVDVWDPAGGRVVGGFNPGRTMREVLLA
ncbi:MAG TPA: nucleoporin [Actinoplanes sp.]|nr:nucleoporin [Actinoplanes sp.]